MRIIITGISGSGKTTIGKKLSDEIACIFLDGDDFHSPKNIAKMQSGVPLDDEDRMPWLDQLNLQLIKEENVVLVCSALKQKYREILSRNLQHTIMWVHLRGDVDVIAKRMNQRKNHFMPMSLLQSQIETYECPSDGLHIDIDNDVEHIVAQIINHMSLTDIGVLGMGVMGRSLALNLAQHSYKVSIYNRHLDGIEIDVAQKWAASHDELDVNHAYDDLAKFINSLSTPRKIIMMIPAGKTVDDLIDQILPLLSSGDILIDGGNSHYKDTYRRAEKMRDIHINYLGIGISGGEQGALHGPSMMVGGDHDAYLQVKDILQNIAATSKYGSCAHYMDTGGAGHLVKMIHNGVEYAEMQLIAEIYHILRYNTDRSIEEIANVFEDWNKGDAHSYLLDITVKILRTYDSNNKGILDQILDVAERKGTGSWTVQAAIDYGVSIPTIAAALFERFTSSAKTERVTWNHVDTRSINFNIEELYELYQMARWLNMDQGFNLIQAASKEYGWKISVDKVLKTWSAGCIIQSRLIDELCISQNLQYRLIEHPTVQKLWQEKRTQIENAAMNCLQSNSATPCLLSAITYYKSWTIGEGSASLIQAQRDYFGAHTFKWKADPEGEPVQYPWHKK
jgi:6-phosphogluconate dehydrogenase